MFMGEGGMSALDIELILEVLRTCGAKMRHEESLHLRNILHDIKTRAAETIGTTT